MEEDLFPHFVEPTADYVPLAPNAYKGPLSRRAESATAWKELRAAELAHALRDTSDDGRVNQALQDYAAAQEELNASLTELQMMFAVGNLIVSPVV